MAKQYLKMLAKLFRNRFARLLAAGFLGSILAFATARGGFSLACYIVGHNAWEQLMAGWSTVVLATAYGIAGAVYGFASGGEG